MGRRTKTSPDQLGLFEDPILWWPGSPPKRKSGGETPSRRYRRKASAANGEQLLLFDRQRQPSRSLIRELRHRLRGRKQPQTYLDLAQALGLMRLQQLLHSPATYYMIDALPLQDELHVSTLLEARYRIVDFLQDAFCDVADLAPSDVRQGWFTLWAGRHPTVQGRKSVGETLSLAIGSLDERVESPFRMRLRGLRGYLGHQRGPSPLEEGEELLSVYDRETLYNLLPVESQPMTLDSLLMG